MGQDVPPREDGRLYLTEAGTETEIMYKWGHELPHFAMFPLLENPRAVSDLQNLMRRQLEVAADFGAVPLMACLDYRASPDWATLLGYDAPALRDVQARCIAFLRDVFAEFADRIPEAHAVAVIGPRGDAYGTGGAITEAEAKEYHAVQIDNIKAAGADLAWAMTFNNIPEAIGVARAAKAAGVPLAVSFTLNSESRLSSGPSLRDAITETAAAAGDAISFFGVNCSHPLELAPALDGGSWEKHIRSIRPNAVKMEKVALCKLGHLEDGDPDELGRQMADLAERMPWMDIFGGCCGTDERHLARIIGSVQTLRADQDDYFEDVPV